MPRVRPVSPDILSRRHAAGVALAAQMADEPKSVAARGTPATANASADDESENDMPSFGLAVFVGLAAWLALAWAFFAIF